MEAVEVTLREEMELKARDILKKIEKLTPGTEEHSKAIEDIVRLSKAINEDYRVEFEMYNQNLKIENERKKDEEEIKVKHEQIELEKYKHSKIKSDNLFIMAGFGILTAGACIYEVTGGHIIPKGMLQFANNIPKLIKL